MKYVIAVTAAVIMAVLLPVRGRAASITWDAGQATSPGAGQVSGTGTFTLDNGWTLDSIKITAVNTLGGANDTAPCTATAPSFQGLLLGLPTGSYLVFATLSEFKVTGQTKATSSTTTIPVLVKVP